MFESNYTVKELKSPIRLSDFVHVAFPILKTRSAGQKAIKKKQIFLNGNTRISSHWVQNGDVILLKAAHPDQEPFRLAIKVVFEDEHLAIIHKPANVNVSGNRDAIDKHLHAILTPSGEADVLFTFRPVHRLDRDTSGLLLIAKTKRAQLGLHGLIERRTLTKKYTAILIGKPKENEGVIDSSIENQNAHTSFKVVKSVPSCMFGYLTLIEAYIETGRTHQIRIHFSSQGLPILGDKIYCKHTPIGVGKGMFLFATHLAFSHPINNKIVSASLELPKKIERVMSYYGK